MKNRKESELNLSENLHHLEYALMQKLYFHELLFSISNISDYRI